MTSEEREIPDMPIEFDLIPPVDRRDLRSLLAMALKEGRSALYRNLCMDDQIDKWLDDKHIDPLNSPRLNTDIARVQQNTIPILESATERDPDSIQDTYRLAMRTAFLEPIVKIPTAFREQRLWRTREILTDDLVGIGARLLERALAEIHNARADKDINAIHEFRGVISELTAALLINLEQPASVATLPGSAFDDIFGKTDLYLHIANKKYGHLSLPIQIKTSGQYPDENLPLDILLINMQDVSMRDVERIAHALVRKISNQYSENEIDMANDDEQIITEANGNIISLINKHVDGIFKLGLAGENQSPRTDPRRSTKRLIGRAVEQSYVA